MARKRDPKRDIAKEIFIESKGTLSPKEIADRMGLLPEKIRKWKSLDQWEEALTKKKRGGQKGNQNAKGAGAPKGNKNAETHGGYSAVHIQNLPEEEQEYLNSLTLESETNMLHELMILIAKERDIRRKMAEVENDPEGIMYVTGEVEMHTKPDLDEVGKMAPEDIPKEMFGLRPAMKNVMKQGKFERLMKLEQAFDRVHGRIIKLLDSIKTYQMDMRRLELDELRYDLAKQKASGAIEIDVSDDEPIL